MRGWQKVMAAYHRVYDSRHLLACEFCVQDGGVSESFTHKMAAWDPTLGNRVWAAFAFFTFNEKVGQSQQQDFSQESTGKVGKDEKKESAL